MQLQPKKIQQQSRVRPIAPETLLPIADPLAHFASPSMRVAAVADANNRNQKRVLIYGYLYYETILL